MLSFDSACPCMIDHCQPKSHPSLFIFLPTAQSKQSDFLDGNHCHRHHSNSTSWPNSANNKPTADIKVSRNKVRLTLVILILHRVVREAPLCARDIFIPAAPRRDYSRHSPFSSAVFLDMWSETHMITARRVCAGVAQSH